MAICLERCADLHIAQLMPLPLTVSCFSKIQIGFTFLVPAQLGSPGQRAVKRVCVCVYYNFRHTFVPAIATKADFSHVKSCVAFDTGSGEREMEFVRRLMPNLRSFAAVEPDPDTVTAMRAKFQKVRD